jgi:hypothetical protein
MLSIPLVGRILSMRYKAADTVGITETPATRARPVDEDSVRRAQEISQNAKPEFATRRRHINAPALLLDVYPGTPFQREHL